MTATYLTPNPLRPGNLQQPFATVGGAGSENQPALLDATGVFPASMIPAAVTAAAAGTTFDQVTNINLAAGQFVAIDIGGTFEVQLADKSVLSQWIVGFVLTAYTAGDTATIYTSGVNDQLSGLVSGMLYLGNSGAVQQTVPVAPGDSGYLRVPVGVALSATSALINVQRAVILD